jgi:hypothetical protein
MVLKLIQMAGPKELVSTQEDWWKNKGRKRQSYYDYPNA